jgi:hypothetical protein
MQKSLDERNLGGKNLDKNEYKKCLKENVHQNPIIFKKLFSKNLMF